MNNDEKWMQHALQLAEEAQRQGEVPVGAVIVRHNELIAEGYNSPISLKDPTAHAEVVVMRKAAAILQNYRLVDSTLYVTLEPCLMCAGAMVHARIARLVYGACEPRAGAIKSCSQVLDLPFLNHQVAYQGGVLASACGGLLSAFFKSRR